MSNTDRLTIDFARFQPEAFARTLTRGSRGELDAIVDGLPDDIAASVVGRLPASLVRDLLAGDPEARSRWIVNATPNHAMTLLTYLPREMRLGLVNDMPAGTRKRTLQRFLSYPAHSVGTLVSNEFAAASRGKPASEVVSELKALVEPVTVVVHDIDGRYLGLMNPQRALVGEGRGTVGDYLERIDPLLAESPLSEACAARQWSRSPVLAVVDHDRRILGVVSSDRVLTAVAELGLQPEARQAVLADLVELYLGVLARLLALLLGSRKAR